ncbi:Os07g0196000 [Oryza sativa Japonica Group]|uniref:Os07g0196000 protein n=3 Tax=Oryza TaxID=4527 RepID=A0A0P0X374_ORYSJ|nr:Os07g0196000 [Oryza sativa Japonica Group]
MGGVVLSDMEVSMMEQGKTTTLPQKVSVTPEHERPEALLDANLKILLMIIVTGVSLGVFVTCLVLAFVLDLTVEGRAMVVFTALVGVVYGVAGYNIIRAC